MMDQGAVLASDMDGTFIPLPECEENCRDLELLALELDRRSVRLLYVTGRHFELAMDAVVEHSLPVPSFLICDVGTSVYRSIGGHDFKLDMEYVAQLDAIVGDLGTDVLRSHLTRTDGLSFQPDEKQGRFKLSFDCDKERLDDHSSRLKAELESMGAPYRLISSIDPFSGSGLIDLLPKGVSKAYALRWWVDRNRGLKDVVMFAGDSGNDLAALTAGYQSIVVGNAPPDIVERVSLAHRQRGWTDRLYLASEPATSGVLQGLLHFTRNL